MSVRVGWYVIHGDKRHLIYTRDVPWDYYAGQPDGYIEPNPIPQEPEDTSDIFTWNEVAAARMIFYVRGKTRPYVMREATMILTPALAQQMGIIEIVDESMLTSIKSYIKDFPDLNTHLYITNVEFNDIRKEGIRIISEKKERVFLFRADAEIPDFSKDEDEESSTEEDKNAESADEGTKIESISDEGDDGTEDEPSRDIIINTNKLGEILSYFPGVEDSNAAFFIPFNIAVEEGIFEMVRETDTYFYCKYEDIEFMFFDDLGSSINESNAIIKIVLDQIPPYQEEEEPTEEEKFIEWFTEYFYTTIIKDKDFLNVINTERTYFILIQESDKVMGTMTMYKGRTILDFSQHDYLEIINKNIPDIRMDMTVADDSFGGYDDDKGYQITEPEKKPHYSHYDHDDDKFGGFVGDESFLI